MTALVGTQGNDQTWPFQLRYRDDADPENPVYTPWNLTEYTFHCQIRADVADKAPVIAGTMTVTVVDAVNGRGNLILSSETSELLSGKYKYELTAVRTADDYITTVVSNTLLMKPRTTVVP